MADDLDLSGFKELEYYLATLPELALKAGKRAMTVTTLWLQGELAALARSYPPYPKTGLLRTMSPKAQRWFFWAVAHGKIPGWSKDKTTGVVSGHYRRTGTLGRSLTSSVELVNDVVVGAVGTNVAYAPWVIGPDYPGKTFTNSKTSAVMYQASVHKDRWWQFEEEVNKRLEQAENKFVSTFFKELTRLSNG